MKISAYTVVRKGERFIEAMIEHIIPYVDELVINVSPSEDNTMEIIAKKTAMYPDKIKIYQNTEYDAIPTPRGRRWFEEHYLRNWTKNKCKGDWIIQQDVDEFYDEEFLKKMREILSETKHEGLFFPKLNFWKDMKTVRVDGDWSPDTGGVKIFKNEPSIGYTGGMHCTVWGDFGKTRFESTLENLFVQYPILHFARVIKKDIDEEGSPEMLDETKLKTVVYNQELPKAVELINVKN